MTPDRRSIDGLQHLRWWAAALIVLYHSARLADVDGYTGLAPFEFLAAGSFGVQLFFVISGLIITIVCLDGERRPKLSLGEFARRRFARIMPILWVAVLLYTGLKFAAAGTVDLPETLRSLTLWPVGTFAPGVIWTLRLEAAFYLLFALTLLTRPRLWWLLALWSLAPLATRLLSGVIPALAGPHVGDPPVWVFLMGHQVGANLQFGAGVLLGLAWNSGRPWMRDPLPVGGGTIAAAVAAGLATTEIMARLTPSEAATILPSTLICAAVVVLSVRAVPGPTRVNRAVSRLGDASYVLYLFHVMVLMILGRLVGPAQLHIPSWLYCLLLVAVAVPACFLVHRFVEAPLTAWTSRRLHARSARPVVKTA